MTTDPFWQTAERVCTEKELQVLKLRDRHGFGTRLIAMHLGISRGSVRERLTNADRKITAAMTATKEDAA